MYAEKELKLTSDRAYEYTRVAEKARLIPELKQAIDKGSLNVSTAKKILTVITPETKTEWIDKAINLKQKDLEREVVKHNPKEAVRDRMKPLTENLTSLQCSISLELEAMIKRVRDLESQRTREPADLASALLAACKLYLEKNDPVTKAKRNLGKPVAQSNFVARRIPSQIRHQVNDRDEGQCAYVDERGERCPDRRWVELHHIQPSSQGGNHALDNLITLCQHHHKREHREVS